MCLRSIISCLRKYFKIRIIFNSIRKCRLFNNSSGKLAFVIFVAASLFFLLTIFHDFSWIIRASNSDYDINFWICVSSMIFELHFLISKLGLLKVLNFILPKLHERPCNHVCCAISIICLIIIFYTIHYSEWTRAKMCEAVFYAFIISAFLMFLIMREVYSDAEINNCQNSNESIGAFWAHHAYDSYYQIVLDGIQERLSEFEEKNDIRLSVKKLMLVIPQSCNVTKTLSEKDDSLIYFGEIVKEVDQGANYKRQYKNPIYKIGTSDNDVYVAAECPNSLMTLWETKDRINNYIWIYHRDCFIRTLKFLVKDTACTIVEYDDTIKSLHKVLLANLSGDDYTVISMES